jgi:ribosomal protein L19
MSLNYFSNESIYLKELFGLISRNKVNINISQRQNREHLPGFNVKKLYGLKFKSGDILKIFYEKGPVGYYFEGICLSINKRELKSRDSSFLLRNVINGIAVELQLSYYYNRGYKMRFSDYKRKQLDYKSPKLYYLRYRLNRESKIN